MKRSAFCLMLILQTSIAFGQSIDTTLTFGMLPAKRPKAMNYTDALNRKQGFWIDYKVHEYSDTDKLGGIHRSKSVDLYSYGHYRNNIKTGKWEYIDQSEGDAIYHVKTEEYFSDGSLKVYYDGYSGYHVIVIYNPTKTRITNIIYGDTIIVTCPKNKSQQIANGKVIYKNQILKTFKYNDFENEELSVQNNFYSREIKRIKAGIK